MCFKQHCNGVPSAPKRAREQLLITRSCCFQRRGGVDVLRPKGWFVNLHDFAVVVVCACVVGMGFAFVPLVIVFPGFRDGF